MRPTRKHDKKIRAHNKEYYATNATTLKAKRKAYRASNPEKIKAAAKKWNSTEKAAAHRAAYAKKNPAKSRAYNLKSKYGITAEMFDATLEAQGGRCAICEKLFTEKLRPCVDHNHTTGATRGLLCHPCNVSLGFLGENTQTLLNAVSYLIKHTPPEKSLP